MDKILVIHTLGAVECQTVFRRLQDISSFKVGTAVAVLFAGHKAEGRDGEKKDGKCFFHSQGALSHKDKEFLLPLRLDPQGTVILPDDGVPFVDGHEALARVERKHGETHAEVRRQDLVPAKPLDFVVVRAGVSEGGHNDCDNAWAIFSFS